MSTSFKRDEIKNDDHLFGTYPKEVTEGRSRVAGLVEKLEAPVETSRSSAWRQCLPSTSAEPLFARGPSHERFLQIVAQNHVVLKLGMPIKAKQSESADRKLEMACKELDIHGHGIARWCMVMAFAGREMLKKLNNGKLSRFFVPLQANGKQLSRSCSATCSGSARGRFSARRI